MVRVIECRDDITLDVLLTDVTLDAVQATVVINAVVGIVFSVETAGGQRHAAFLTLETLYMEISILQTNCLTLATFVTSYTRDLAHHLDLQLD